MKRIQRLNKRLLVRSFPKSLYFQDNEYRTTKFNEGVEILCKTEKGFGQKNEGRKLNAQFLPPERTRRDSNPQPTEPESAILSN